MPIESSVYQVMLVMPDDIDFERTAAKNTLFEWNSMTGRKQNIHLGPVEASHVDFSRSGIAEEIDIVLGTFWTTTDNGTAASRNLGDVVRTFGIERDIPSIVGFSERDIPTEQLDAEEYGEIQNLREDCRDTGFFTYTNSEEYEANLKRSLTRTMDGLLSGNGNRDETEHEGPSEYDVGVDFDRLEMSESMHREQDEQNIEKIVEHFQEIGIETPYRVLDAGAGYGTVTKQRFGGDDRFEVLGIDNSRDALQTAKNQYAAQNIEYRWLDVNNLDAPNADLGTFDLVFASYLFHHLDNQESVLSLLWDRVREGGAIMIRSCDDGQHIHYPPDEDMKWIVNATETIPGASDRTHGRRIPTQMKRLSPSPEDVRLDLKNYDTVGRDSNERREYWDVFHSNRLFYAKKRAERDDATREDKRLYKDMSEQMARLEEKITGNEHVFDAKSVPVVVAMK